MRRIALGSASLIVVVLLTLTGGEAWASTSSPMVPKAGHVWTLEVKGGICEVQTFAATTWTADKYGDAGKYSVVGKYVVETWTAGTEVGDIFFGKVSISDSQKYPGLFRTATTLTKAHLVKGAVSGC